MFTRQAARTVFTTQHLERWAFDVELLLLCSLNHIGVWEQAVNWHDVDGSHLNVVSASIEMARDMMLVKLLYLVRIWRIDDYSC